MLFISDDVIQSENFWGFTKHIDKITKWELFRKVVEYMRIIVFEFDIGKTYSIFLFARMWWPKIKFGIRLHNMVVWVSNWQSYSVVFIKIKTWQPFHIISTDNCKQCVNHMVYTKFQIRARLFLFHSFGYLAFLYVTEYRR